MKRHTRVTIIMHWFNALCWFFLLATGLGLIKNEDLQILGGGWTNLMRGIFGSGEDLLLAHEICGLIWAGVFLVYGVLGSKRIAIPFLKEIFTFLPSRDFWWIVKKGIQMTMGNRVMEKLGFDPKIPDQGFYNVGQKLFAIPSVLGGMVIAATGIVMVLSDLYLTDTAVVQWAILIHFITVVLVFGGLLIHIYMASIASGERPAFISMFTGSVPEEYAMHHHKLWYDRIKNTGSL